MSKFEYLLGLVSVLVGVALSNLATSTHTLIIERHRVKWDWLSPMVGGLATLSIIRFWWKFYQLGQSDAWENFGSFLFLLLQLFQLTLLASCALPDESSDLDLRAYYARQSRYFWLLSSSYVLGAIFLNALAVGGNWTAMHLGGLATNLLFIAMSLLLGLFPSRRFHEFAVPLTFVYLLISFYPQRLS
jgi:hypothetical protein